ncbi:hypothetical protein BKA62DRAFT_671755 [Auriculariales sp. MPI-PUGE-AT-0066]|nr:hypothetical protein BKA62DRAFT_671755 [Auriculariales sp. MPI-PUGE-AT-0066]
MADTLRLGLVLAGLGQRWRRFNWLRGCVYESKQIQAGVLREGNHTNEQQSLSLSIVAGCTGVDHIVPIVVANPKCRRSASLPCSLAAVRAQAAEPAGVSTTDTPKSTPRIDRHENRLVGPAALSTKSNVADPGCNKGKRKRKSEVYNEDKSDGPPPRKRTNIGDTINGAEAGRTGTHTASKTPSTKRPRGRPRKITTPQLTVETSSVVPPGREAAVEQPAKVSASSELEPSVTQCGTLQYVLTGGELEMAVNTTEEAKISTTPTVTATMTTPNQKPKRRIFLPEPDLYVAMQPEYLRMVDEPGQQVIQLGLASPSPAVALESSGPELSDSHIATAIGEGNHQATNDLELITLRMDSLKLKCVVTIGSQGDPAGPSGRVRLVWGFEI